MENHLDVEVGVIPFPPDKELKASSFTRARRGGFIVACVGHGVDGALPSVSAVQMLSEKKRIRAKVGWG